MCLSSYNLTNNFRLLGAGIFFGRGVPNLQKVGVNKTATPLFRQQNFYDPHCRYTLPPKQAKIVLFISLFEQNKHTICGHLVTPYIFMILVIKNFMTPLFFFPRIYDPQYIWDPFTIYNMFSQVCFCFLFFSLSGVITKGVL